MTCLAGYSPRECPTRPVVIDNRGGLGGAVGAELTAHAKPDGYTLLYCTNAVVVNPSLLPKIGYQLRQLAPISLVATLPIVITVPPSSPVKTIPELVAYAKQRNGVNYGLSGIGSINHLTGALFNQVSGVSNTHVPFKGAGPQMIALLAGEVDFGITTVVAAVPHIRSGRLRPLAVTTLKPVATLPGVPTMASYYPGFTTNFWHGFFTSAGTPTPVIALLNTHIIKALRTPDLQRALQEGGAESVGSSPDQFAKTMLVDHEKYSKLVKASGAQPD